MQSLTKNQEGSAREVPVLFRFAKFGTMRCYLPTFLASLLLAVQLFVSGCSAPPASRAEVSAPVSKVADSPAHDAPEPPTVTSEAQEGYATLTNLEMVEYCLPYPADYKEDYDAAEEKGQHVFISKDKKVKIKYAGNPYDDEFVILYHDLQAEVQEEIMKDPLVDEGDENHFDISWERDKRRIWIHKWNRPAEKETVTVQFEYPSADAAAMKPLIQHITSANTRCE